MKHQLTERQSRFLSALPNVGFCYDKAKREAGYSNATASYQIVKGLRKEILELTETILASGAPSAALKLVEIINSNSPIPQAQNKIAAAQSVLDRAGAVRKIGVDIGLSEDVQGLFILPAKQELPSNET